MSLVEVRVLDARDAEGNRECQTDRGCSRGNDLQNPVCFECDPPIPAQTDDAEGQP